MARALVYVVPIALAIFALFDLARSLPEERAGVRRWVWVLVVVLIPVLGPLVWIIVSRYVSAQTRRPSTGTAGGPGRPARGAGPLGGIGGSGRPGRPGFPGRPGRRSGPVAPDDDPEFLWRLEQQRRRASGEPPTGDDPAAPPDPGH